MFNGGVTDDGEGQKVLQSHITGPTGGNEHLMLSLQKRLSLKQ